MDIRVEDTQTIVVDQGCASPLFVFEPVTRLQVVSDERSPEIDKVVGPAPRGLQALGWRFFQDAQYATTPLYCPAGVRTQIPDNGSGMLSNRAGVNSDGWLNVSNGRLYPDAIGDAFLYRLNLTLNPTINNKWVTFDFDQGTPNRVWNARRQLAQGAGVAVPDSFETPITCGAPIFQNGGAFYVTPDCDLLITRISIQAIKLYSLDPLS